MTRDPTAAPTRDDRAYSAAQYAGDIHERALDELARLLVESADARFGAMTDHLNPYSQRHIDFAKANKPEPMTPHDYAVALVRETLGEIYDTPPSPEDAAESEYLREGDILRERD